MSSTRTHLPHLECYSFSDVRTYTAYCIQIVVLCHSKSAMVETKVVHIRHVLFSQILVITKISTLS